MLITSRVASYLPKGKEKKAMQQPKHPVILCLLIVCLTLLIFTLLTRHRLCEVRLKDGNREVSAVLAYESRR